MKMKDVRAESQDHGTTSLAVLQPPTPPALVTLRPSVEEAAISESFWRDFRDMVKACRRRPELPLKLALASALTLATLPAAAQSWQTVDDFQYVLGQDAENTGLTVVPNGTLFACGWGNDSNNNSHAVIMAGGDAGATWSAPLDDFTNGGGFSAYYNGITSDRSGNIYGIGYYYPESGAAPNYWFVRRSVDGGITWSTTDVYHDSTNNSLMTQPYAVCADAAGNVYVGGYSDSYGWMVRKGIGGTNFTTVDAVPTTVITGGAYAIYAHPTAGIFAAGVGAIGSSKGKTSYGWVTRRTTNGGATWSTVDAFSLSSGSQVAKAYGIGPDALGNLFVVGRADAVSGSGKNQTVISHWIVRKSATGGSSWNTVDDFTGGRAYGFSSDASGNLFTAGLVIANGTYYWTVRANPGGSGIWQTVDDFNYFGGAAAGAFIADDAGHVLVGGYGWSADGVEHWLVRRH